MLQDQLFELLKRVSLSNISHSQTVIESPKFETSSELIIHLVKKY